MPDAIPDAIARFLRFEVDSVRELETLLALRESSATRTAEELGTELRSGTRWTEQQLERLRAKGLVSAAAEVSGRPGYRYAPLTAELAEVIDTLAALYATHRVTVVRLIYAEPDQDVLRAFSDAFRIRREEQD